MESGEGEKRENCSTSLGKRLLRTPPAPARGTAVRRAIRAAFMAAVAAVGGCSVSRSARRRMPASFSLPLRLWRHLHVPPLFTPTRGAALLRPRPAPPTERSSPGGSWRPLAPPLPLPPPFAVARRQPRGEATVPPGCPEPWRRAAPADLGKRAMSAPCRLCLAVSLGDASTDLLKVWDPCTEVQREQNSILTPWFSVWRVGHHRDRD